MGLKIQDDNEYVQHARNGSTNISDVSYDSADEQQSKTVWMFDEQSVQKLRIHDRPKKMSKLFDNCDSMLDDESNDKTTDLFQMATEQSDITASLYLFKDDTNSYQDSDRSSHNHE